MLLCGMGLLIFAFLWCDMTAVTYMVSNAVYCALL